MAQLEQRILIRTDLGLTPGLITAQVAHIHAEIMRQHLLLPEDTDIGKEEVFGQWLESPYIFVHGVPNLEMLNYYTSNARSAGVPVHVWTDMVYMRPCEGTCLPFNCKIGASFGPADSDEIKGTGVSMLDLLP